MQTWKRSGLLGREEMMTGETEYQDEWGRKFEVIDCPDCRDGEVWYPGCGDQAATCRTCEGVGQIERRK